MIITMFNVTKRMVILVIIVCLSRLEDKQASDVTDVLNNTLHFSNLDLDCLSLVGAARG